LKTQVAQGILSAAFEQHHSLLCIFLYATNICFETYFVMLTCFCKVLKPFTAYWIVLVALLFLLYLYPLWPM